MGLLGWLKKVKPHKHEWKELFALIREAKHIVDCRTYAVQRCECGKERVLDSCWKGDYYWEERAIIDWLKRENARLESEKATKEKVENAKPL